MLSKMGKDKMLGIVAAFVAEQHLLDINGKYIVALSGGADSVALLLAMCGMGYSVEAAHCNFHLRGEESDRDELFCEELCKRVGVALHRIHFDTKEYAKLHKVSIEMAARDLRYAYFEQLRKDILADGICVAHHKDDNVETVLLNIIRGTGLKGLTGISPKNGHVIRPLLCVGRTDIVDFLAREGQGYVTDSTNLVDDVQRNKVRLNVIPMLESVNSAVKANVMTLARWATEASKIVESSLGEAVAKAVTRNGDTLCVGVDVVNHYPSPEYLLWHILRDYGFSSAQTQQIAAGLGGNTGSTWLSASHELVLDRGKLLLAPLDVAEAKVMRMPETGVYVYSGSVKMKVQTMTADANYVISRSSAKVCLDAGKVKFPLVLRRAQAGDRFVPFGMKGSKLVSDFLTDQKVPLPQKRRQLVVADADGHILWVVGRRVDGRAKITCQTTAVLEMTLLSQGPRECLSLRSPRL